MIRLISAFPAVTFAVLSHRINVFHNLQRKFKHSSSRGNACFLHDEFQRFTQILFWHFLPSPPRFPFRKLLWCLHVLTSYNSYHVPSLANSTWTFRPVSVSIALASCCALCSSAS